MALTYVPSSAGSTGNPPIVMASVVSPPTTDRTVSFAAGRLWFLNSTCDITDYVAAAAISDASVLGVKAGDALMLVSGTAASTAPKLQLGVFVYSSVGATGAALSSNVLSSTQA